MSRYLQDVGEVSGDEFYEPQSDAPDVPSRIRAPLSTVSEVIFNI